jgi:hypothetical protein
VSPPDSAVDANILLLFFVLQLYSRSLTARTGGDSGDSARSGDHSARSGSGGRKTPREDGGDAAASPNDRLRKQARCLVLARCWAW